LNGKQAADAEQKEPKDVLGRRAVFVGVLLAAPLWVAEVRAACGPADLEPAVVQQVSATGDIGLADGRRLRTAGLHLGPVDPASWPRPGDRIAVGILGEAKDRWSRLAALVFTFQADGSLAWLQQRLIANGGALLRPESGLDGCFALLAEAEAAAKGRLMKPLPESGRFVRATGRVQRTGEGRSAYFITIQDPEVGRVTGLLLKRHLRRFSAAGVDVTRLRGQVIRLRGTRSVTNAAIVPLTMVEQIEIVR
jgi:hypothetical protein